MQNELLESMLVVIRGHIMEEVKSAKFVAIQADETTVVSTQTQLVLVLRYIDSNGEKLIVQAYDGASVMRGVQAGVQQKVCAHLKNAHYVYYYVSQVEGRRDVTNNTTWGVSPQEIVNCLKKIFKSFYYCYRLHGPRIPRARDV